MKIEARHCRTCGHVTPQVKGWTNNAEVDAIKAAMPGHADVLEHETWDCWLCTVCGKKEARVIVTMTVPKPPDEPPDPAGGPA